MSNVVTPASVEARLVQLGKEIDVAHTELVDAEAGYYSAKGNYEVAIATARIKEGTRMADKGVKVTVQEREDIATIQTATELRALYTAEAVVRAARANVNRIRTQVDIARSVGSSVRASLETV